MYWNTRRAKVDSSDVEDSNIVSKQHFMIALTITTEYSQAVFSLNLHEQF